MTAEDFPIVASAMTFEAESRRSETDPPAFRIGDEPEADPHRRSVGPFAPRPSSTGTAAHRLIAPKPHGPEARDMHGASGMTGNRWHNPDAGGWNADNSGVAVVSLTSIAASRSHRLPCMDYVSGPARGFCGTDSFSANPRARRPAPKPKPIRATK